MPKITLTFQLPDEQEDLDTALKANSIEITINDMDNYLRSKLKYEPLSELEYKIYEEIREKLHELMRENGL